MRAASKFSASAAARFAAAALVLVETGLVQSQHRRARVSAVSFAPVKLSHLVLAGSIGLSVIAGADPASDAPPDSDKTDTLLKAINFALLGNDDRRYVWKSREQCIVMMPPMESVQSATDFDTFYLNHIDVSRMRVESYDVKFNDHIEHRVKVELHGEDVILEQRMQVPANYGPVPPAYSGTRSTAEYTYTRETTEYERMVRAWKYIYSHGCHSAKASF